MSDLYEKESLYKDNLLCLVTAMLMAITTIPIIKYCIPSSIYYIIVSICYFIILFRYYELEPLRSIFFIIMVIILSILQFLGKDISYYTFLTSFRGTLGFFCYILLAYCLFNLDKYQKLQLWYVVVFCLFITIVTTCVGLKLYPSSSRYLSSYMEEYYDKYSSMNIGGYGFIYSLIFIIPTVIYRTPKANKVERILLFVFLASAIYCIFLSQYSIGIGFSVLAIILSLVWKSKNKNIWIALTVFFVFGFLLIKNEFGTYLLNFSKSIEKDGFAHIGVRVREIGESLTGNISTDGDLASRIDRYMRSFELFLKHPILGNVFSQENIGGHSTFFDELAATGIFGTSIIIWLISQMNYLSNQIYGDERSCYKVCFILFVLLSMINNVLFESIAVVMIAPTLIYLMDE